MGATADGTTERACYFDSLARSRGGPASRDNFVTCCQVCNQLKSDHLTPTLADARRLVAQLRATHTQRLRELREVYR